MRIVWWSWWIFSFILTVVWSGTIISFITTPLYPSEVFSNADELASQSTFKIGTYPHTNCEHLLKKSFPKIWERIEEFAANDPNVLTENTDITEAKLAAENYVYIEEGNSYERFKLTNCKFI